MGLVPAAYLHGETMPSRWIVTLLTRLTTRRNPYASDLRLRYPTPPLWVPTHNMTIGQRLAHDEAYRGHMQAWMLVRFRRERARAAEFGCTRYVWRSSGDDCARCSALDGRRFAFGLPPVGGHPGECLECGRGWCRCAMEPINAGFD